MVAKKMEPKDGLFSTPYHLPLTQFVKCGFLYLAAIVTHLLWVKVTEPIDLDDAEPNFELAILITIVAVDSFDFAFGNLIYACHSLWGDESTNWTYSFTFRRLAIVFENSFFLPFYYERIKLPIREYRIKAELNQSADERSKIH